MKNRIFAFVVFFVSSTACVTSSELLMQQSHQINPGMSKEEVIRIMGSPTNRQFKMSETNKLFEALQWDLGWHKGLTSDFSTKDMLIVYFLNNKVTDLENYIAYYGRVKSVVWEERPDYTIELRSR
jgi:outer membrane protein assembly factor BamE (lipoprotein component of BamABCDE complex)